MATTWFKNDPMRAKEFFENKMSFTTGPVELDRAIKASQPIAVIDVRARDDFEKEHIPGAISMPESEWANLTGLSKDRLNVIYCYSQVCHLAARAAVEFAGAGFAVRELEGGFKAWKEHRLATEGAGAKMKTGQSAEKADQTVEAGAKKWPESPRVDEFTTARMSSHH